MADVDVSVVVVAYNSRASILDCLSALDRHRGEVAFDVVVVDNASQDGTAEAIEQAFPDVRLCRLTENVGFGRAVNRAATEISTEYLLLLNPDAEPVGSVVDELVRFARAQPGSRPVRRAHAATGRHGRWLLGLGPAEHVEHGLLRHRAFRRIAPDGLGQPGRAAPS